MAGQPRKTPVDETKFRNAYMANLNARAKLDAYELQVGKNYVRTGQPSAELTDSRTLTEIYADEEQLKIMVRKGLLQITDGANAQEIVNSLSPDQLRLVAQRLDAIVKDVKPAYKLGIPALNFLQYVNRLELQMVTNQGISDGLQQVSGADLMLSLQDIRDALIDKEDLANTLDELRLLTVGSSDRTRRMLDYSQKQIESLRKTIPSEATIQRLIKEGKDTLLTDLMDELPTRQAIADIMAEIQLVKVNQNPALLEAKLQELTELVELTPEILGILKSIQEDAGRAVPKVELLTPDKTDATTLKKLREYSILLKASYPELVPIIDTQKQIGPSKEELQGWFRSNYGAMLERLSASGRTEFSPSKPEPSGRAEALLFGNGICGRGVAEDEKYIPFGRYVISKRQLEKDIVALKTKTGASLNGMPSTRVSKAFGNAMRSISGGAAPSFDEIQNMTDEERHYLHKIATTARIADRLKIPSPDKSKDEQDINRFNVLRGQVSAGQDSREAIKELKLLIIKLKNKDLLPARQAKDILYELTELGY